MSHKICYICRRKVLPPILLVPSPLLKRNVFRPPPFRLTHSLSTFYLSLCNSFVHHNSKLSRTFSFFLSCRSVMSYRHVIMSHTYVYYITNLIRIHLDNIYVTTKQYTMSTMQSIKFYTYKQLLYILIQFNIINYNQKNELLTTYIDKL